MKIRRQIDLQEDARVLLKITIPKAEIKAEYDETIKEINEKAEVKGFRKGKVPVDILIRKFGDLIKQQTTQNLIQKSLEQTFQEIEQRPLSFAPPELVGDVNMELDKDFSFQVSYDTYPQIELGQYKGLKVEKPQVNIQEQDIERELKILQDRNTFAVAKQGGTVEKGDVVTIDYVELDEKQNEIPDTKRQGFVFDVGSGKNIYGIDDDIIGMKQGQEKNIAKSYDEKDQNPSLAGRKLMLKVKVTSLKIKEIPAIDDKLANDISDKYETLDDLKNDLKQKLELRVKDEIRQILIGKFIEQIVKKSKVTLPKSLIDAELNAQWQNFIVQNRTDETQMISALKKSNKTKEDVFNEWKPKIEENLKSRVTVDEIIKQEKIQADDSEVEAEIKKYADSQSIDFKQAKETYEKMNMINVLKGSITREKAYKIVVDTAEFKKGAKMKFLDLIQRNY